MDNLKTGDRVQIKETGEEATITGIENNTTGTWYYLTSNDVYIWNEGRERNYFTLDELDYTNDQKEWMQYEANLHAQEMQAIHPPLEYL